MLTEYSFLIITEQLEKQNISMELKVDFRLSKKVCIELSPSPFRTSDSYNLGKNFTKDLTYEVSGFWPGGYYSTGAETPLNPKVHKQTGLQSKNF